MTTGLSGPSTLMATDETVFIVRQPTDVPQGVTYVDGKPVRNASQITIFPCVCNVQPIGGKELALLDSGDETTDQLYVWTNQNAEVLFIGDIMLRRGKRYQCQATDEWGNYTRARFALDQTLPRLDPDADVSFLP